MNVTYIGHSGFAVELPSVILMFDYYKGKIPQFDNDKPIYVFSSHFHEDHFSFTIFELLKKYDNIKYILSNDIKRKYCKNYFIKKGIDEKIYNNIVFISANSAWKDDKIKVETLHSTDEGVAFIIEADGKTIYHAGDLNWWVWQGESSEYNNNMTANYKKEISKIKNRHFDIAFVPLDPRQEGWFYKGFDYFMSHTDTDVVYPMHFWGDNSVINKIKSMDCSEKYRDRIMYVE